MNAKEGARETVNDRRDDLIRLSHLIHANPEIAFEEEKASTWLSEMLSNNGFEVRKGVFDLPTAFIARAGSGPLHLAICAEYDCLPGIGHACGHNIIAAMAVGAGIAAAKIADEVGLTISVIGTPAEEILDGGGKILLLERGAFAGVHAAMMVHPAPIELLDPSMSAAAMFDVHYTGKAAHASAFPELGINAADALTIAQTAVGLLRQHIRPTDRIHGIITKGGDAPNIVPSETSARYVVRASSLSELEQIRSKVQRCFEAGAIATGSKMETFGGTKPYSEMKHDTAISAIYRRNSEALGRQFAVPELAARTISASSDMGNVSLALPAIHPTMGIDSLPAVNHQPEFAAHCTTESADNAVVDGSLAMAWTAVDVASDAALRTCLMNQSS